MEQTTPETEVSQGITEEQAMQQLLGKWGAEPTEEQPTEEAEEEVPTEQAEEATAEEGTETEEAEEVEGGEVEIDVAGEKFKAPAAFAETAKRIEAKAKEVEAGATRKFQEAADLRKAAETQAQANQQLQKIALAQADLLADHKMVMRRLQAIEQIDIQGTDPETLTRLNAEYNQLQAAKARLEDHYRTNVQQMTDEEKKSKDAKLELGNKQLAAEIKGWGPDYAKKLAEYAVTKGAPNDVLAEITDAWMVKILDDAAYGHAMRQAKPEAIKRAVQAPQKTLKPNGSGATKPAAQTKADDAFSRSRKSGRVEDAAMALLARANLKRK